MKRWEYWEEKRVDEGGWWGTHYVFWVCRACGLKQADRPYDYSKFMEYHEIKHLLQEVKDKK